jgi:8-oxo-dGTP diphosphatase
MNSEYCYAYPRPALTVDIVLIYIECSVTHVLLIQRKHPPFAGQWALPGGFVDEGETLQQAALRELEEETGLTGISIQQIGAFAAPGRDPRGWTVSVAFAGLLNTLTQPKAADDAVEVVWCDVAKVPASAFDHNKIVNLAIRTVKEHKFLHNKG